MRGEDEELKEKVRNEAGEFQERNVEEKREKKFPIGRNSQQLLSRRRCRRRGIKRQRKHIRISMQSLMHLMMHRYNNSSLSLYLSSVSLRTEHKHRLYGQLAFE